MARSALVRHVRTLRLLARLSTDPTVAAIYWARCELAMRRVQRLHREARRLAA